MNPYLKNKEIRKKTIEIVKGYPMLTASGLQRKSEGLIKSKDTAKAVLQGLEVDGILVSIKRGRSRFYFIKQVSEIFLKQKLNIYLKKLSDDFYRINFTQGKLRTLINDVTKNNLDDNIDYIKNELLKRKFVLSDDFDARIQKATELM